MGKGAARSHAINAFKKILKTYDKVTEAYLIKVADAYARQAVIDAVDNYLESSGKRHQLTGNTLTGFSAGIYRDGRNIRLLNALEVYAGLKGPTAGYAAPGVTGFQDYGSNEHIHPDSKSSPYVRDYNEESGLSFVPTDEGGSSIVDTARFLEAKHTNHNHIVVVVANHTPYLDFLVNSRGFDILQTLSFNITEDMIRAFKKTKFNEYTKPTISFSEESPLKSQDLLDAAEAEWRNVQSDNFKKFEDLVSKGLAKWIRT